MSFLFYLCHAGIVIQKVKELKSWQKTIKNAKKQSVTKKMLHNTQKRITVITDLEVINNVS